MGCDPRAIIARGELLRATTQALPEGVVASLEQGLALVPITDGFFGRVTGVPIVGDLGFWRLPAGFQRTLADWSVRWPVAYAGLVFGDESVGDQALELGAHALGSARCRYPGCGPRP